MKNKISDKNLKSLEKEYKAIVKNFDSNKLFNSNSSSPQWMSVNDSFVKFSLYNETPNSISSTDTLMASSL